MFYIVLFKDGTKLEFCLSKKEALKILNVFVDPYYTHVGIVGEWAARIDCVQAIYKKDKE